MSKINHCKLRGQWRPDVINKYLLNSKAVTTLSTSENRLPTTKYNKKKYKVSLK